MSTPIVIGSPFEMDSRELFALTFDVSGWLAPGDPVVAGTAELRRISDDVNYTAGLRGVPGVTGQLIAQELQTLEKGERYWLILPFTSAGRTFAPRLMVTCPVD